MKALDIISFIVSLVGAGLFVIIIILASTNVFGALATFYLSLGIYLICLVSLMTTIVSLAVGSEHPWMSILALAISVIVIILSFTLIGFNMKSIVQESIYRVYR